MTDSSADEIREMLGDVELHDCYLTKEIKVTKLKDKLKLILDKTSFDITRSHFPECVNVLAKGKDLLVEATVPEEKVMSKYLTEKFKDGKYESTIDRKRAQRQTIFESIFGSRAYYSMEQVVDSIYKIDTKADFLKGEIRLRHKAINELKAEDPSFLVKDKRIHIDDFRIEIQPRDDLVDGIDCRDEIYEITEGLNLPVELENKIKELKGECELKIKNSDYRAYKNYVKIKSVLKKSIMKEVDRTLAEVKDFEDKMTPRLIAMKQENMKQVDELKSKVNALLATWDQTRMIETSLVKREKTSIRSIRDVPRSVEFIIDSRLGRDWVKATYCSSLVLNDSKEQLEERQLNKEIFEVGIDVVAMRIPYYLHNEEQRYVEQKDFVFFIERMMDEQKRKFIIYNAKGIWMKLETADYMKMKPHFDEDMDKIMEVEI